MTPLRVELLLSELRLPGIKRIWVSLAEQSDKHGWPAARFLACNWLRFASSLPFIGLIEPDLQTLFYKTNPIWVSGKE